MNGMGSSIWWQWHGLALHESAGLSMLITLVIGLFGWSLSSRLRGSPSRLPPLAEALYQLMHDAVAEVLPPKYTAAVFPFIATLWVYILVANLIGLVPGLSSPTRDLSITSALAVLVFVAVHGYGIRAAGWRLYLSHYLKPSPILLPFHLISEVTRTLALAIRLFGNMMSLEMAAVLVLLVAGLLVPIPLLLLHVVEALVQAYIFGMLALIYIASALEVADQHTAVAQAIGASPSSSDQESSHE